MTELEVWVDLPNGNSHVPQLDSPKKYCPVTPQSFSAFCGFHCLRDSQVLPRMCSPCAARVSDGLCIRNFRFHFLLENPLGFPGAS